MIKITHLSGTDDAIIRVRVEGRVVQRTAGELTNACATLLRDGTLLLLDLSGVSFVDADGALAIAALTAQRVTAVGCSPFVNALLRSHAARDHDPRADDEADLAARLRRRDPGAGEELVRRYGARLLGVARRVLGSEDDARAAVQQAFLSAFDGIDGLGVKTALAAWLRRLVIVAALRRLENRRRTPEAPLDALLPRFDQSGHWAHPVTPLAPSAATHARSETCAAVRDCIDRLPESFRTILVLRDVEELDADETAAALGTSAQAVQSRLHRARQALHTLLARELGTRSAMTASGALPPI